ncbi:sensor histidine kinase [Mucilaginibacter terrenus]|uniref:histidine kinase n=1 Tax=Mucilaginibacter terrenus TaxID=2482727 RepID=A0A3E2NP82_9SPHI|nr:ATP-binding protein [Mucilaginibacter terrenus]RFZ82792.1 sensor histidine kinase [Mucilaginibacter terrenus]
MTTAGKIRGLLLLLFISLLVTAIFVERTYSPATNLSQTAQLLEKNLHEHEADVAEIINTPAKYQEVKRFAVNHKAALDYIQEYTVDKGIWLLTMQNGRVNFWSGPKIAPDNASTLTEGSSFIKTTNGYYEAIKKTEGSFSAVFFIPVKYAYAFQNKYLQNIFNPKLTEDTNIEIADFTDKGIYAVHNVNGKYLFSVKLIKGEVNNRFFYFELTVWILTILSLCILVHVLVTYLAHRGWVYLSLLALALFIVAFRFVNLHYGWPSFTQPLKIFNPQIYGSSYAYPSLGDFCINILCICWFVAYMYSQRARILRATPGKLASYLIYLSCFAALLLTSSSLLQLFNGLVIDSKISFDVNNVLNLSRYSLVGVLMLCFSFLTFVLLTEVLLTISFRLSIPVYTQAVIFVIGIIAVTIAAVIYDEFSFFYLLWSILVLLRGYYFLHHQQKFTAASFIMIVLVCAVISAIKLNHFEEVKEENNRKLLIQRLEVPDDVTADTLFKEIEPKIIQEPAVINYYKSRDHINEYLATRLQKLYFDRYLAKYEFKVHAFDMRDNPISGDKTYELNVFKDMVQYSAFKVSKYFYRENESFGYQSYFAILPVVDGANTLGTIVIELKARPLMVGGAFPELLIDRNDRPEDEFKDYSYAFYTDNKLIGQNGNYVYSVVNNEFKGELKKYTIQESSGNMVSFFNRFTRYSHLIYKPSDRNLIVVSKQRNIVASTITALTFFFVVILAFSSLVLLARLLWLRVKILNINNDRINWNFKINFDKVLYKTRIQFSMIFAVVITLILVGIITFVSISKQYQGQQDKSIRNKITLISAALEAAPIENYINDLSEERNVDFDKLADNYSADLTLFDLSGRVLMTTQPKIYQSGLLSPRMNGKVYLTLKDQQKSELVNDERISDLFYKSAYAPLRNAKHETVAYLQLPYFANEADYNEQVGSLLNIMINVYALVFIAIGLFAVIIARQITAPLNFIQYNLSRTIYGKKNEPIKWERDDEIGALVKEYNNMISALESSARKLAQSERETAWREMAKQVAHEIKNPLTPLKLGLQLLDKSWKDKDPKFDQKFERFSKSFVEQIESLSSIASEFSAFAKMPDTRIETINIFEMLAQAVTIFKHMDNVKISLLMPKDPFMISADRDQVLRCFNNLLKNAIEATPPERTCLIQINYLVTSKNVLLTIKDNGNGIPENMRDKIFEPNFTTKSSGTGLGLAFVKNSIENASGKIWFETNIGVGTTFYLNFPALDNND